MPKQSSPNILLLLGPTDPILLRQQPNIDIQKLAASLPTVIKAALAPKTSSKYERAWSLWKSFCYDNPGIAARPADPFYIAVYFNYILTSKNSRGAIVDAYFGIRWGHHSSGFHSPTDHPFVKLAFEGSKRLARFKGSNKKDPMTATMIRKLYFEYGSDKNLLNQRFLIICILGFAGFMRTNEMLALKVEHIKFYATYMSIFLPSCKTDQLREGNTIVISKINSLCCPVSMVKGYIKLAELRPGDYLICKLVATKKGHKVIGSHSLSYSRTRAIFLKFTEPIFPGHNLGLHGLRAGGASTSSSNNVHDRLISKHGRWRSDKARDGYIRPTLQEKLFVTKNLGL